MIIIEEKSILSHDGIKLSYQVSRKSNDKPFLFFLHGAGSNHTVWEPVASGLPDYNLIIPDLRGHGTSGTGKLSSITIRNYALDIKTIIDNEEIKKVILVGNSLGSSIAVEFSLLFPDSANKMVLISLFSERFLRFSAFFNAINNIAYIMMMPFSMKRKLRFQDYVKIRQKRPWYFPVADIKGTHLHVYSKSIKELLRYPLRFEDIQAPSILLQGKHDIVAKNAKLYKTIKNLKNITFRLIDTHHLIVNKAPDTCAQYIRDFT